MLTLFRMDIWCVLLATVITCCISVNPVNASEFSLKTDDIRIRDPFIYADQQNKTYYMYAQSANREKSKFIGVEVYTSQNLQTWSQPQAVLVLPEDAGIQAVWAPEMHEYKGRYYLFVTLTYQKKLSVKKPVDKESWPEMHKRGTHIFHADSPMGPFKPFKDTSHTPEDWMALDGTLYVESGIPYMVFCHEWVQTIDGTMDYLRLKEDLSDTIGEPQLLFKASSAPGQAQSPNRGKVTDGCYLYRSSKTNRLFMIWSTFISGKGYCVLFTHSGSGKIGGPWKEQKVIYTENGGHGMIFKTFEGRLIIALHQPNDSPGERLHLFEIVDNGETLKIEKEIKLRKI